LFFSFLRCSCRDMLRGAHEMFPLMLHVVFCMMEMNSNPCIWEVNDMKMSLTLTCSWVSVNLMTVLHCSARLIWGNAWKGTWHVSIEGAHCVLHNKNSNPFNFETPCLWCDLSRTPHNIVKCLVVNEIKKHPSKTFLHFPEGTMISTDICCFLGRCRAAIELQCLVTRLVLSAPIHRITLKCTAVLNLWCWQDSLHETHDLNLKFLVSWTPVIPTDLATGQNCCESLTGFTAWDWQTWTKNSQHCGCQLFQRWWNAHMMHG